MSVTGLRIAELAAAAGAAGAFYLAVTTPHGVQSVSTDDPAVKVITDTGPLYAQPRAKAAFTAMALLSGLSVLIYAKE